MNLPRSRCPLLLLLSSIVLSACLGTNTETGTAVQIATGISAPLATQIQIPNGDPAASASDAATFRLSADGQGDFPNLETALLDAPPGSTILLGPGSFALDRSITLTTSLALIGTGMDQTEITAPTSPHILHLRGDESYVLKQITFRQSGSDPADVVSIEGGHIEVRSCRFTGGVWHEGESLGNGLVLGGDATGIIEAIEASQNGFYGMLIQDSAMPTLQGNWIHANEGSGIGYFDQSGGGARDNVSEGNAYYGILIADRAAPTLENNTIRTNQETGFVYLGHAGGTAQGNLSTENGIDGFLIGDNAAPLLTGNTALDNVDTGISYLANAGGRALENRCMGNAGYGIYVAEDAAPTLDGNRCSGNGTIGIAYFDRAAGTAQNNESNANGSHGIYADDQAAPILKENECSGNDDAGIAYFGQSAGRAERNHCAENATFGIYVADDSTPTLEDNRVADNADSGIAYFGQAAGVAERNQCDGNVRYGIFVEEDAMPMLADNACDLGGKVAQGVAQDNEGQAPAPQIANEALIGFASDRNGDWEIYVMDSTGERLAQLTDSPGIDWNPDASPDGTQIAFESQRDGNSEIYIMQADGSSPINLTQNPAHDSSPAWSPDGRHIAFTSNRDGNSEIYVVDAEGDEPINLTQNAADDANPDWAPDGHHLVFESDRSGELKLYVLRFETGEVTRLSADPGSDFTPVWSPDGQQIAFTSNRDGSGQVYVSSANGGSGSALTSHPAGNGAPAWSPDGEQIVFTSYRDGPGEIYVIHADGSNLVNLTQDPANDAGWPSWWIGEIPSSHTDNSTGGKTAQAGLSALMAAKRTKGPDIGSADDLRCADGPIELADGDWTTAAPTDVVVIGDSAQLGLRNRAGQHGETDPITATVVAPDGSEAQARSFIEADDWTVLVYPEDFSASGAHEGTFVAGEGVTQRGEHTVIWESNGKPLGCDTFTVGGGAS
jgi:parallel beta-helix repeat protein